MYTLIHRRPVVAIGVFVLFALSLTSPPLVLGQTPPQVFVDETTARLPADADCGIHSVFLDVEGDGDLDIFVSSGNVCLDQNRLFINDGSGVFVDEAAARLPVLLDRSLGVAVADVDRDSDPDVFYVGNNGSRHRMLINNGLGFFSEEIDLRVPGQPAGTNSTAFVDVDGDGDPDLLFGSGGAFCAGQPRLLLNNGSGFFSDVTATHLPPLSVHDGGITIGDVDGDTNPDIFLSGFGFSGSQDRLLINDGSGVFTDETATRLPVDSDPSVFADFGDVDADGDLDLFIPNHLGHPDRLLINDGAGFFSDETASRFPTLPDTTVSGLFSEYDRDGDLDLFVSNQVASSPDRLLINDGLGFFVDETSTRLPTYTSCSTIADAGDIDGDGDLDIVVANFNNRGVGCPTGAGQNPHLLVNILTIRQIAIDIKPGSDPNSINCNNYNGVIPVAILTTGDFDATAVDHTSVTFEGASETHVGRKTGEPRRHEEDVDSDGDTDLVFHFRLGETDLTCDSTEGTLTGETFDGQAIEGTDTVNMINQW